MRRIALLGILILTAAAVVAVWALPNRPVTLEPPPGGKLQSVSFAPFRDGQSPLTKVYPSLDQLDEDLRSLRDQVAGIRTYTSLEGMENVPGLARRYGLTVIQGAWLGSKLITNEQEITSVIRLANAYPDVIKRVIVGNEVLLRGDLTPEQLAGYLARVRKAIKQPVSYADVWEFWLLHPEMASSVDFITIHLLPYWENDPAGVDTAAARILNAHAEVAARFPGKPILVGEAGWPTAGRSRGPAVPGVVNKARFDAAFIRVATDHGFDYNLIEAFDQSWKIKLEGTVGGKWGFYGTDRRPKFSPTAPVVEDAGWPVKAGLSVVLGLALVGLVLPRRARALPLSGEAVVAVFAMGFGAAFVRAADIAISWHYYVQDVVLAVGVLVLQAIVAFAILIEVVRLWQGTPRLYDAAEAEPAEGAALTFWGGAKLTGLTLLAVVWTLLLIVDGRYRDFPVASYLIPALGVLALALVRAVRRPAGCDLLAAISASHLLGAYAQSARDPDQHRSLIVATATVPGAAVFAALLLAGAPGVVLTEGLINREALAWAGLLVALAVPYLATVLATIRGTEPLPPVREL